MHHDVFDFDLESPPVLMDVRQGGRTIPAVAVVGKSAIMFLLDRVTGKPIYRVEERPVAQSDVPGEKMSPTQPFPVKPAPVARIDFTMADIATVTPELEANCRKLIADNNIEVGEGPVRPDDLQPVARDLPQRDRRPELGRHVLQSDARLSVRERERYRSVERQPGSGRPVRWTSQRSPARIFPAAEPVRTRTSRRAGASGTARPACSATSRHGASWWRSTSTPATSPGRCRSASPTRLPEGKQNTGRPNIGGSIATAGGLVFIGATDDSRFRAFDAKTGKELWVVKLNASSAAVPSTYQGSDGKQYVVVTATGPYGGAQTSDEVVAFTLK